MYTHALIKVFRVSVGHAQDVGDMNKTRERNKRRNISEVIRKTGGDTSGKRKHDKTNADIGNPVRSGSKM